MIFYLFLLFSFSLLSYFCFFCLRTLRPLAQKQRTGGKEKEKERGVGREREFGPFFFGETLASRSLSPPPLLLRTFCFFLMKKNATTKTTLRHQNQNRLRHELLNPLVYPSIVSRGEKSLANRFFVRVGTESVSERKRVLGDFYYLTYAASHIRLLLPLPKKRCVSS